jgi:hypothetical protein
MWNWYTRNKKTIGYSVGLLNIVTGIREILANNDMVGIAVLIIGLFLIFDAWEIKREETQNRQ